MLSHHKTDFFFRSVFECFWKTQTNALLIEDIKHSLIFCRYWRPCWQYFTTTKIEGKISIEVHLYETFSNVFKWKNKTQNHQLTVKLLLSTHQSPSINETSEDKVADCHNNTTRFPPPDLQVQSVRNSKNGNIQYVTVLDLKEMLIDLSPQHSLQRPKEWT